MGINLTNFLSSKSNNTRMIDFQDLDHIDGLSISVLSANLYKNNRDDLTMFYFTRTVPWYGVAYFPTCRTPPSGSRSSARLRLDPVFTRTRVFSAVLVFSSPSLSFGDQNESMRRVRARRAARSCSRSRSILVAAVPSAAAATSGSSRCCWSAGRRSI